MTTPDLNLLVSLAALLEHRSVTKAAQSLNIGQPAMSGALSRLRRLYGDELLVRVGQHYTLTPLAESLRDQVAASLDQALQTLSTRQPAGPANLERTFRVGLTEYELNLLGGPLMEQIIASAPGVRVQFDLTGSAHIGDFADRLRHLDCLVVPDGWLLEYPRVPLFDDVLDIVVATQNKSVPEPAGPKHLAGLRWCLQSDTPLQIALISRMTKVALSSRSVVTTSDSFLGQMNVVGRTDLACPMPRRLVDTFGTICGVRRLVLSDPPEQLRSHLAWHPARQRDHGLAWLRDTMQLTAQKLSHLGGL